VRVAANRYVSHVARHPHGANVMAQEKLFVTTDDGRSRVVVIRKPASRFTKLMLLVLVAILAVSAVLLKATDGFAGSIRAHLSLVLAMGLCFSALTYSAVRICFPDEIEFRPMHSDTGRVIPKNDILLISAAPIVVFIMCLIWVFLL